MKAKRPRSGGTEGVAGTAVVPINPTPAIPADPPPAIPIRDKLLWDLNDITLLTGLSRRLLEKELSAGRFPRPDLRIGRRCLWKPATIKRFLGIEEGGRS
jgi:predicted DNA-binding transcriptional regulator AlpA